jgi:hypothetical protein
MAETAARERLIATLVACESIPPLQCAASRIDSSCVPCGGALNAVASECQFAAGYATASRRKG